MTEADATNGARRGEDEHRRRADEQPARDRPVRRGARHSGDRSAPVVPLPPRWEWSFEVDGALALDRDDASTEPDEPSLAVLKRLERSVSVPRMPQASRQALPAPRRRETLETSRRARRLVGLASLAVVALVTLLLTAFGTGRGAGLDVAAPAPAVRLLPAGPPRPQVVAFRGPLRIELPVAQSHVTAIGYHAASDGALALEPVGRQVNEGAFTRLANWVLGRSSGRLRYFQLPGGEGPGTAVLNVGAAPGTDVYSPVDGTVVGLTPNIVNGKRYGARIDIQPTNAPSLVVAVTHVAPDDWLSVGSSVTATTTKLGAVVDFSAVERQALARYTQDAGNHVSVQVYPTAATAVP